MARDRILSNPLCQEGARPTSQHNFYQEEKTALERKRNGASKPLHRTPEIKKALIPQSLFNLAFYF